MAAFRRESKKRFCQPDGQGWRRRFFSMVTVRFRPGGVEGAVSSARRFCRNPPWNPKGPLWPLPQQRGSHAFNAAGEASRLRRRKKAAKPIKPGRDRGIEVRPLFCDSKNFQYPRWGQRPTRENFRPANAGLALVRRPPVTAIPDGFRLLRANASMQAVFCIKYDNSVDNLPELCFNSTVCV